MSMPEWRWLMNFLINIRRREERGRVDADADVHAMSKLPLPLLDLLKAAVATALLQAAVATALYMPMT